jgi:hypothetical protein
MAFPIFRTLPDEAFTASSARDENSSACYCRMKFPVCNQNIWGGNYGGDAEYMQGALYIITELQLFSFSSEAITKFSIKYSDCDSSFNGSFRTLLYADNSRCSEFFAQAGSSLQGKTFSTEFVPFLARYVRLQILAYSGNLPSGAWELCGIKLDKDPNYEFSNVLGNLPDSWGNYPFLADLSNAAFTTNDSAALVEKNHPKYCKMTDSNGADYCWIPSPYIDLPSMDVDLGQYVFVQAIKVQGMSSQPLRFKVYTKNFGYEDFQLLQCNGGESTEFSCFPSSSSPNPAIFCSFKAGLVRYVRFQVISGGDQGLRWEIESCTLGRIHLRTLL